MKCNKYRKSRFILTLLIVFTLSFPCITTTSAGGITVDVTKFGADPLGKTDSAAAVHKAIEYAKTFSSPTTIFFPKGEYHFWQDYAPVRELYVSNTIGSDQNYKDKSIGILIEDMNNVVVDGGGSMFIYHGDITTMAAIRSNNIDFKNFDFDFASPTVVDVTVESRDGDSAIIYVPECYNYSINGSEITWYGETSPTTGRPYWSGTGTMEYAQIYDYNSGRSWRTWTTDHDLIRNVQTIEDIGNNRLKFIYKDSPGPQAGHCYQMRNTTRTTPGALIWESRNVTIRDMKAHYLHGFGIVGQLSDTITIENVDFVPRAGTGRITAGFADFIQMSSIKGKVTINNCNFAAPHDDPINIHGTYMSVDSADNASKTYILKYKHGQSMGFPQFYPGDQVEFVRRSTLLPVTNPIATVVSAEGPYGEKLDTIKITLDRAVEGITGNDIFAVENITYTPEVEITNNFFTAVPTRGILVTTRRKVLIENNHFDAMHMPAIYISCDAQSWYESGPAQDVTIRNNIFDRTQDRAILIEPTNNSSESVRTVHQNIIIEDNVFNIIDKPVLEAKSVTNLVFQNNTINRYAPDVKLALSADNLSLETGKATQLTLNKSGASLDLAPYESPLFNYTNSCRNATIRDNTYDWGLNQRADGISQNQISIINDDIKLSQTNQTTGAAPIMYASTNDAVASVDGNGVVLAKSPGTADIFAYTVMGERSFESNKVTIQVSGNPQVTTANSIALSATTNILEYPSNTLQITATTMPQNASIVWSVADAFTNQPTSDASISGTGLLTVHKDGAFQVIATSVADLSLFASKIITAHGFGEKLHPAWSISNQNSNNWKLENNAIFIKAGEGGMWGGGEGVKNIFLTDIPSNISSSFSATLKMTGRTSTGYEESGMVFMINQNNYVSLVRKNGNGDRKISVNSEANSNASEYILPDITSDVIYFKISRSGANFKGYFSSDGQSWTEFANITNFSVTGNFKIGMFAGNANGSTFKFEEFTVIDSTKSVVIPFIDDTLPPVAQNLDISADQTAKTISLTYDYNSPSSITEGNSLYRWYASDTSDGHFSLVSEDEVLVINGALSEKFIKAEFVPVDKYNKPGAAIQSAVITAPICSPVTSDAAVRSLNLNGIILDKPFSRDQTNYNGYIPLSVKNSVVTAQSRELGTVMDIKFNGITQGTGINKASAAISIPDGVGVVSILATAPDGITSITYTISIKGLANSQAVLYSMSVDGVTGLSAFDPSTHFYRTNATIQQNSIDVSLTASANMRVIANDMILSDYDTTSVTQTISLLPGANIIEIWIKPEDGTSIGLYRIVVNKTTQSICTANSITVDGQPLENFVSDRFYYDITVPREQSQIVMDVTTTDANDTADIMVNGKHIPKTQQGAVLPLEMGLNKIVVSIRALTSKTRQYVINAVMNSESNPLLQSIQVENCKLSPTFNQDITSYSTTTDQSKATLTINAYEANADITIFFNNQILEAKGQFSQELDLFYGSNEARIKVASPDGTASKTYWVDMSFFQSVYLSDINWSSATVGDSSKHGGKPAKDQGWEYPVMRLTDQSGDSVAYSKGIGTHANSEIVYNIDGYTKFISDIGVDYVKNSSSEPHLIFKVLVDDVEKYTSEVMYGNTPFKRIEVDVDGAEKLTLIVTQSSNVWSAHANWADARLVQKGSQTLPSYAIQVTASENGSVSTIPAETVTRNDSVDIQFSPENGYYPKSLLINDQEIELSGGENYRLEKVQGDVTITTSFAQIKQQPVIEIDMRMNDNFISSLFRIQNETNDPINAKLMLALYKQNGALQDTQVMNICVDKLTGKENHFELMVPNLDGHYAKAYIWGPDLIALCPPENSRD